MNFGSNNLDDLFADALTGGIIGAQSASLLSGNLGSVVVAGCMAERQRDVLLENVPEVDQIVGVFGREDIAEVVNRATHRQPQLADEQRSLFRPAPVRALEDTSRLRITLSAAHSEAQVDHLLEQLAACWASSWAAS